MSLAWVVSQGQDFCTNISDDNASGSAALIDIARCLNELISSGRMPLPERTIRLLWVPEFSPEAGDEIENQGTSRCDQGVRKLRSDVVDVIRCRRHRRDDRRVRDR